MSNKVRSELLPTPTGQPPMMESPVIQSIERGMFSERMELARKHPRDQPKIANDLVKVAISSLEIAESCEYLLPNKQAEIRGPSVHLARLVMDHYANADAGAIVLDIGREVVTAQGVFIDLEANRRVTTSTVRSIVGSSGNRYSMSMIQTTANAACSIAYRQAVFNGIPRHIWGPAYNAAREMARGRPEDLVVMRERAVKYITEVLEVPEKNILLAAGVGRIEDIGLSELFDLRCRCNAIRDGDATKYEAFPSPGGRWESSGSSAPASAAAPVKEIQAPPLSSLGNGKTVMEEAALTDDQQEFLQSLGD